METGLQERQTATADPRLRDGRWRSALGECLALYRAVTGDLSQDQPLEPTDMLALGPYTVIGLIGQGGMGRVYSARAADGTKVAIKALIAHAAAREAAMPRFRRELAAARSIEGALTARVVDADLEAVPPWLATEYIHGPTLQSVVDALGPLPPPAVAALAMGVASALTDIHAAGVVHRDLKPSNILLTADGLRVVDFGIARTTDGTTITGGEWTLGTPAFMAPEQIVGEPVRTAADVFALGSVLVYAATGEPPFGRDEATAVMYRTVHDAPELEGVLEPLRAVIEDCLEKNPSARPTPAEVIDRTFALLGRVPARQLAEGEDADTSDPVAETVVTPVLDAVDPPPVEEMASASSEPATDADIVPSVAFRASSDHSAGRSFRGVVPRSRRAVVLTVGAVIVAAGAITAIAVASQRSGNAGQPGQQLSLGAASHPTGSPAARPSQPSAGTGAAVATATGPAVLPGTFLAGPGCATSPWTDTVQSLPAGDQFVANVTGGDPQCGGVAAAFRKSGSATVTDAGFTWEFHMRRAARCTLSIYVAATASSSGGAVYELTAAGTTTRFAVNQATLRGQWVQPAGVASVRLPDGVARLRLTDAGGFAGDRFHVTASSVRAQCS